MKNLKVFLLAVIIVLTSLTVSCSGSSKSSSKNTYTLIDTTLNYNYAYIRLQNGECVEGKIDSWSIDKEYDRLIISMDGKKYCVHLYNCTLVYDPDLEVK